MAMNIKNLPGSSILLIVLILAACTDSGESEASLELTGRTMGTRFNVQVAAMPTKVDKDQLAADIRARLEEINAKMSTYDPESEISRFNRHAGADWFPVSDATARVVAAAIEVSIATDGAFDVTVGPLVNLWGFGPESVLTAMPDASVIQAALARIGYQKLAVRDDPPGLRKSEPTLYVDLSAIAKGYGVDQVAELLERYEIHDYLVDIGGELRVQGENAKGRPWQVAIESPVEDRKPFRILSMSKGAVATSGNYRNYFELGGQRFSHTLDPRTGRPVTHNLVSATVLADDAMTADAWATALIVLGRDNGLTKAEEQGLAVFLLSGSGQQLESSLSTKMQALIN